MTELAIIGSDIQEVIGSAIAFQLLFGLELWYVLSNATLTALTIVVSHLAVLHSQILTVHYMQGLAVSSRVSTPSPFS